MKLANALHRLRHSALDELMSNRRLMKSIRRLRRLARVEVGNFQVHLQLGLAYTRIGAFSKAAESLHRAIFLNPQHHPTWVELGLVEARRGRAVEARKALETALDLHPGDVAVEAHLSRLGSADWPSRPTTPPRSRPLAKFAGSLRLQRLRLQRS